MKHVLSERVKDTHLILDPSSKQLGFLNSRAKQNTENKEGK